MGCKTHKKKEAILPELKFNILPLSNKSSLKNSTDDVVESVVINEVKEESNNIVYILVLVILVQFFIVTFLLLRKKGGVREIKQKEEVFSISSSKDIKALQKEIINEFAKIVGEQILNLEQVIGVLERYNIAAKNLKEFFATIDDALYNSKNIDDKSFLRLKKDVSFELKKINVSKIKRKQLNNIEVKLNP